MYTVFMCLRVCVYITCVHVLYTYIHVYIHYVYVFSTIHAYVFTQMIKRVRASTNHEAFIESYKRGVQVIHTCTFMLNEMCQHVLVDTHFRT